MEEIEAILDYKTDLFILVASLDAYTNKRISKAQVRRDYIRLLDSQRNLKEKLKL